MEENSWRGLVLAWANRLQLTNQPAQQMIDFTDGKFFAAFMMQHMPSWKTRGQTRTETFAELEAGFKEEFTSCSVVNMACAMEGHEDDNADLKLDGGDVTKTGKVTSPPSCTRLDEASQACV